MGGGDSGAFCLRVFDTGSYDSSTEIQQVHMVTERRCGDG